MKESIVSFKTAKLAKELGFDLNVFQFYDESGLVSKILPCDDPFQIDSANFNNNEFIDLYSAPTLSLLQKWLREKLLMFVMIEPFYFKIRIFKYLVGVKSTSFSLRFLIENNVGQWTELSKLNSKINDVTDFETYEHALDFGLYETLKALKNLNKK